jgi:hypothetical protein
MVSLQLVRRGMMGVTAGLMAASVIAACAPDPWHPDRCAPSCEKGFECYRGFCVVEGSEPIVDVVLEPAAAADAAAASSTFMPDVVMDAGTGTAIARDGAVSPSSMANPDAASADPADVGIVDAVMVADTAPIPTPTGPAPQDDPKTEPPTVKPPKTEPPKTELPKAEPPKAEPPKEDTPKADAGAGTSGQGGGACENNMRAMCSAACVEEGSEAACPASSICKKVQGGAAACLPTCISDAECAKGSKCAGVSGSSFRACEPNP